MSTSISVRISDQMAKKLDSVSKDTERPKSYHIQKALEQYLEERAELQVALDRLNDTTDSVISIDEMRNKFEV